MKLYFTCTLIFFYALAFAQPKTTSQPLSKLQTWQLLDYEQDSVYGTSVNRAYKELLKGKKSQPVIVAVIDEGVDITQEDLQGHIWTNKKEIAGNGIDDDKNGYTDDVNGWNFLGGADGKMMYAVSSDADREYARLLPQFSNVKDSAEEIKNKDYQYFLLVKKRHKEDSAARMEPINPALIQFLQKLSIADSTMKQLTKKQNVYLEDLNSFEPKDSVSKSTKQYILNFYAMVPRQFKLLSFDSLINDRMEYIQERKNEHDQYAKLGNDPNELRKEIVGDDPLDINDTHYGNNIVGDKYAEHGTHCSGIIAAIRNNGIGMDGITDNVLIMSVRAGGTFGVGDESDKDIALAIRYAADNGAKIISMSFGKIFSPQKQWVDDAVKYAEKKGVLLIHAAGNDYTDIDTISFYPTPYFLNASGKANNMITVGAMSSDTGFTLTAPFSNYGQKEVDVFAPGVEIYSSVPGNKYKSYSGTSMAAPVVAGVAALIWEYYPMLNAAQVKDIILRSVTSLRGKMVNKPGTHGKVKVDFATLCVSGGVVNAYKALQLAATISSN
ncbi:MAG: S8 family serine peptidase, partial [Ferruginibacter sp.]